MTEWTGITIMKRSNIGYYFREGISSIFTHGFMSFASVCIIVACLIIMGSFALLALNVNEIIADFESENVLLAFVDERLAETDARAIKSGIMATNNVSDAVFVTREEAMEKFFSKYDDRERFENISEEVFRHRYVIYVDDIALMEQTQYDLASVGGIDGVNANITIARGLVKLRNIVSGVSVILAAILLIISFFIMSNTIKLATFERREEIAIMKIVGATDRFIRWPFIWEGFLLGLFGSLLAFLLQWGVYDLLTKRLIAGQSVAFIRVMPFSAVALPMCFMFIIIGFVIGVVGSSMAIRKYLKV